MLVHDMGSGEVADARLAEGARSHLREHLVAGSLEPEAAPRNLAREVEAAVLTNDGTLVLDLLVSHENKLEAGKDVGMSDTSGRSEQAPSPRHGFISFLSPALGGVIVAGGRDDRGKPTPSVHLYRLGMGRLTVDFPYELSDVRAAAYCPHDGMLWVLDARDEGTMEVVRMNPLTGEERRGGIGSKVVGVGLGSCTHGSSRCVSTKAREVHGWLPWPPPTQETPNRRRLSEKKIAIARNKPPAAAEQGAEVVK